MLRAPTLLHAGHSGGGKRGQTLPQRRVQRRAWMTNVLPEMPPMWNALSSSRVANTVPRPVAASRP